MSVRAAGLARWLPLALAALAGCLLLVVFASPPDGSTQQFAFIDYPFAVSIAPGVFEPKGIDGWSGWLTLLAPVAVTAIGLWLLRWWPYLLAAAGLLAVPGVLSEFGVHRTYPLAAATVLNELPTAGYILAIIALLACAQGVLRVLPGWSAVVVALALGARLIGSTMLAGLEWEVGLGGATARWRSALLLVGLAALAPVVWRYRKGDPDAVALSVAPSGGRSWRRARPIVAGALAVLVPALLSALTVPGMAGLLGTNAESLWLHEDAYTEVIGAVAVVAVTIVALLAGRWALAGTLTVSVVQVAAAVPVGVAFDALTNDDPLRWLTALAGVGLGALIAGVRWRVPIAAALAVLTALTLFVAYSASDGDPGKLVAQQVAIPSAAILLLSAAAGAAITGSAVPALGGQGALPAVLGPLVGVLAVGGLQALPSTNEFVPLPLGDVLPAGFLFLVAGVAVSGLGFARLLAARSAERKHAEQIRQESAAAERDRLGRSIHDGVLQVLALVQREGQDLGGREGELAALAGQQEVALRALLASEASQASHASLFGAGRSRALETADLSGPLQALAGPAVEVATPAQPVELPSAVTAEVVAAVKAALDNVRGHAGQAARAWILLEEEAGGVRVTVRDDGVGFRPERPAEAAAAGRLGIAQSMRGRIADCGGTTTIDSRPGEGTEVEFWIPRDPRARR